MPHLKKWRTNAGIVSSFKLRDADLNCRQKQVLADFRLPSLHTKQRQHLQVQSKPRVICPSARGILHQRSCQPCVKIQRGFGPVFTAHYQNVDGREKRTASQITDWWLHVPFVLMLCVFYFFWRIKCHQMDQYLGTYYYLSEHQVWLLGKNVLK